MDPMTVGFRSRNAQARSAHKTLDNLERLREDYLPGLAEQAYRGILGFRQNQAQILERWWLRKGTSRFAWVRFKAGRAATPLWPR